MSFMQTGPASMLKDGSTFVDDPVIKNIDACRELAKITRSSMGPYGLCKMVINHLNKLFVTHDAATILRELEVEHPAAKLLVQASNAMQEEVGDGTNFVVSLAGELLSQAESLVRMGLHPSEIVEGYKKAGNKSLEILETLTVGTVDDVLLKEQVMAPIRTAIASKQYGHDSFLANLVVEACINACPTNTRSFNVDNVRVAKLDGDCVLGSRNVRGFVIARNPEGVVRHQKKAKIAVYACAVDVPSTETKGTALIETADELLQFSRKEEEAMEEIITNIHKTGVNVIVSNSTFGDLALHYLNRYGIMAVKVPSKFELRRLCAAVGARTLSRLDTPTVEDIGSCDNVDVTDAGGKNIISFVQDKDDSKLSTIVVRGATKNVLDDVERAIDDGVNVFKALTKDKRLVAGAGAVEMELQRKLKLFAETSPGLDQYAIHKFASSFEVVARTLAEVSGFNGTDVVTQLEIDHNAGKVHNGVGVEDGTTIDSLEAGIVEPYLTKYWAINLATEAVLTVLQVNQIIVAKQAGGPKNRPDQARDDD
ncbi:CCT-theta, putative [Trypanosoma brucei gambiense DAL972]|uniref:CCT-theta n=2 Tax=Trypanosoma brucei TaxID=5691 RepID=D0A3R6_TRYB9|nr:CCT-theta, putative [Trypanosoma brucei gambiense DAL972]RHW69494.1 T-complex protein 1 [Trypanosoma brucei equiperdum]CBH15910.1 CCT-theta, putative [Trypanosoma brucei gambiense DAL972]|eukprot:XP_011778174.1 CCT-theta, putative [Trypanosoma brucei gambiense DAL972]